MRQDLFSSIIPGVKILMGPQGGYDGGEVMGGRVIRRGGGNDEREVRQRRRDGRTIGTGQAWLWDRGVRVCLSVRC